MPSRRDANIENDMRAFSEGDLQKPRNAEV